MYKRQAVIYGRSTSTSSFNRKVGIGSSGHDLVGDCMISLRTSAALHGENDDSDSAVAGEIACFTISQSCDTVVTLRYLGHIGSITWKVISWIFSLDY